MKSPKNNTTLLKSYFIQKVSPALVTIVLNDNIELPLLKDAAAYLAVKMNLKNGKVQYALIEISKSMDRFVVLPKQGNESILLCLMIYFAIV